MSEGTSMVVSGQEQQDSPPVVSDDGDFDDDDFGDFEEAEENYVSDQAVGMPVGLDTERIQGYMTTTMTPDEYEQMFRNDLEAAGMGWKREDAIKSLDNPVCQRRFTDLEGPDMYGSLLVMERPEPSEDEKDPMKMARRVRSKIVEDLVGFPID